MRHLTIMLIGIFAVGCGLRGNGVPGSQIRTPTGFDSIEVQDAIHATIGTGPWSSLVLTGDENLLPLVETTVSGTHLTVFLHGHGAIYQTLPMKMTLTLPSLVGVAASGASTLNAEVEAGQSFSAASSGDAIVDVHGVATTNATVDASGSAVVRLAGRAQTLSINASGDAQVLTQPVSVAAASIDASGTSQVEVEVSQSLTASLSGVSRVRVWGQPSARHVESSGESVVQYQ